MSPSGAVQVSLLRLFPGVLDLIGPGSLDEHNPQDALIFDAGKHALQAELLAQFYAHDIWEMDWARDYLMDTEVVTMAADREDFKQMFDLQEMVEEEIYNKADLTTIESDASWADTN
jgi:hypothetical protein